MRPSIVTVVRLALGRDFLRRIPALDERDREAMDALALDLEHVEAKPVVVDRVAGSAARPRRPKTKPPIEW